jgi:DNA-binding CsgD family transcriptional regulator
MSIQGHDGFDYEWLTPRRVRVMRELEADYTEREAAEHLGVSYESVRSTVEELKAKLGVHSVREIRQWWRAQREGWVAWCAEQAGVAG